MSAALNSAVKKKVLAENVSRHATKPPKPRRKDAQHNVWDIEQVQQFLGVVKQEDNAQIIALFALALDSGARKCELLGLRWSDLNGKQLCIEQQVLKGGNEPQFTPPKRGSVHSLEVSDETNLARESLMTSALTVLVITSPNVACATKRSLV